MRIVLQKMGNGRYNRHINYAEGFRLDLEPTADSHSPQVMEIE